MTAADSLRTLDAKMTEGPWHLSPEPISEDWPLLVYGEGEQAKSNGSVRRRDAAPIVAIRNALPELVALVEAAEAVNDASERHDPFTGARADMALCAALLDLSGRLGEP
jgi:hypothetical protein